MRKISVSAMDGLLVGDESGSIVVYFYGEYVDTCALSHLKENTGSRSTG